MARSRAHGKSEQLNASYTQHIKSRINKQSDTIVKPPTVLFL